MSTQRVLVPLVAPSHLVFKFASAASAYPFWSCQHAVRSFSSTPRSRTSSKRKMQTSTAYNPRPLDVPPLAPRNPAIPKTFMAGSIPQVNETRPPTPPDQIKLGSSTAPEADKANTAPLEQEAHKSSSTQQSSQSRPKSRPKIRARKAAMTLTPNAVKHLRVLLDQPEPKLIKVGTRNRGCSGLTYTLDYVDKPGAFDETVEQDGVKVLIDSKALFSIIGSEMDWLEDKLSQRFVFNNPNTKESCGCGESFMV